jgi:hypothetical protein
MSKITRPTSPHPDIPLPAGAGFGDIWERVGADDAHRVIMGANRGITDSDVIVWTPAIQFWDGSLDTDGEVELPAVHIDGDTDRLNSDQARELAAALSRGRHRGGQVGSEVTTTTPTTPDQMRGFTLRELVDELVRRVGPDEACRLVGHVATSDEMLALADEYDRVMS